ncbi:MAG: ribonuclease III domain-containing protein [Bacillota bacterium]|nr:Mini-ribonuclease 3 [Clostridiales bacterium]MDD6763900.1 ribonuclease III domain-containing protein [Bacillota bacterium]MDY5606878.1 ribonuclease III domain-containing protein [Lentihominibacter sp.]MCI7392484.1 Mini-ribonuclease 3 [Clostridiales bacterium]MDD6979794.1 ribonuclease III domain-containing protein [Bacillota bacterium]
MNNLKQLNTEALAYMGDAVFEQYIREMLLRKGIAKPSNLHRAATEYVRAQAQAKAIKTLMGIGKKDGAQDLTPELTEEEQHIVKRGRNHKFNSKAKNADPVTYKWATAFEALVGYLYLSDRGERLAWLMKRAVEIQNGE